MTRMKQAAQNRLQNNKESFTGGLSGLLALLISYALTLDPEASPKVIKSVNTDEIRIGGFVKVNIHLGCDYNRESPHS